LLPLIIIMVNVIIQLMLSVLQRTATLANQVEKILVNVIKFVDNLRIVITFHLFYKTIS